jgi:hypothetical protein
VTKFINMHTRFKLFKTDEKPCHEHNTGDKSTN